jgi:predicted amidohydrolase YtcJ
MRTHYRNGRILVNTASPATGLLVEDGRVVWLGDGDEDGPADRTVDLAGALVTPAFVDAHVHTTGAGLTLTGLDLTGATSLVDALNRIERQCRAARGRPVLGHGWDETTWPEHRRPTIAELDRAAYGGAVYLSRVDVHSALASSALLAATPGVTSLAGFRPDGWLAGEAQNGARTVAFSSLGDGQIRDAQRATRRHAASLGIGCLHEMGGPETSSADDLAGLIALAASEPGPDVIPYWAELFGIDTARELGAVGAAGDLYCDGSIGSHTALFSAPYEDAPDESGELVLDADVMAEHVRRCVDAGLQAGFHAIGDAAVDAVVTAFERLGPGAGVGHRIEHAELVSSPARLAATGLTVSMQPAFDALWGGGHGLYAERLGVERSLGSNRFADLARVGSALAFGSDVPVTPLDPWGAVRAAAHHHTPEGSISVAAAFAAHTVGGWQAARRDGGELAAGAPATFAVWSAGPVDEETGLPDVSPGAELPTCVRTVVRGETIFELDS